jgi:hypothetical protein
MARMTWPIHWAGVSGFPSLNIVQGWIHISASGMTGGGNFCPMCFFRYARVDPWNASARMRG